MSRHEARQRALELLFSREFHGENDIQYRELEILEREITDEAAVERDVIGAGDSAEYCAYLLDTVSAHRDELDRIISTYAKDWDVSQMNKADKNIMRLALAELQFPKEPIAANIILNEAVRLAKEYSGVQSSRFVNGILGAYVRRQE
ncbi:MULTISPECIES: transcription antitermination factor NusB [Megasphaera]|uniref:Transcription antitermination protein NusB n=1 Tax=Megasphaera vaginalis (ex Srinivasan et al. 2021) TaxID=1111454 RepID=U7UCM6_9FIRM|nr:MULTISPECIES: transcription antitermination factor NusB [Megasphaera]ERT56624.1 transcription antitermination factor NusB [Megasphaera vaginalis (ex Srinivasan et al. 2021)]